MTDQKEKPLMSPANVREIFNISRPTELRWRNTGQLPAPICLGRRIFYRTDDIKTLIEK
jgi:predicted site-specific integrase-resolvase